MQKHEGKQLSNFESFSNGNVRDGHFDVFTQDALRKGSKRAVSETFTFEMIEEPETDRVK